MLKFLMYIKKSNGAPVTLYATQDKYMHSYVAVRAIKNDIKNKIFNDKR